METIRELVNRMKHVILCTEATEIETYAIDVAEELFLCMRNIDVEMINSETTILSTLGEIDNKISALELLLRLQPE